MPRTLFAALFNSLNLPTPLYCHPPITIYNAYKMNTQHNKWLNMIFESGVPTLSDVRKKYNDQYHVDESAVVTELLKAAKLSYAEAQTAHDLAFKFVTNVRETELHQGGVEALMHYYDLSCEEGVLLMCLAEALLRVPDTKTKDALIQDKIGHIDWDEHLGGSESAFVNLATRGLQLGSKIVSDKPGEGYLSGIWKGLIKRTGVPVVRKAVRQFMKILSEQFVLGETIEAALKVSKKFIAKGYSYSYDKYQYALAAIGRADPAILKHASMSVKLSALHPRYEFAQREKVIPVLEGRLLHLCKIAKETGVQITVDAEESDRLDLSLTIIQTVFEQPELKNWNGLGLALQAYQTRAFWVIDYLTDMARRNQKILCVRLVKGAYWDSEIKIAQENGISNYPVFTRKANTDVSYLACARKLLKAQDAIYPQFATHNVYSVAAILAMMGDYKKFKFEFQNLQGMGKALHDQIVGDAMGVKSRIYAPVGVHEDLLPYLVRRLLENGANSSFINQMLDENISIEQLIENPVEKVESHVQIPHPKIPLPKDIYGATRLNSAGMDFSDINALNSLKNKIEAVADHHWVAAPTVIALDKVAMQEAKSEQVVNPANVAETVGSVIHGDEKIVDLALQSAEEGYRSWYRTTVHERAQILRKAADLLEAHAGEIFYLINHEAGRTLIDAMSELREAVDFCRYYAQQAEKHLTDEILPGPTGEMNYLTTYGRGIVLCISPWNFPVAIFTGQVVAALVAGNCVIAKPAEPTPLTAALVVNLLHKAGVPMNVLQLMPGRGSIVGQQLVSDLRIKAVLFTGSNATAERISQTLVSRGGPIVPLIAETGGINAMIADSSALPEQLVVDVIRSAFGSAGQRCSALRLLYVQSDIADAVIKMLHGAMQELVMGSPDLLSTDIGPVIDQNARSVLEAHVERLSKDKRAHLIAKTKLPTNAEQGTFFPAHAFELDDLSLLTEEVFGPVLHVIRYDRNELDEVIDAINNLGYGLTFGVQSRIDTSIKYIVNRIQAGNIYVNRNMIGAVVGVQPFGGSRLSGTGPKAGGPHYLYRLIEEKTISINTSAVGGNASLMALEDD